MRGGESYSLAARGMTHLLPADRRKDGWVEEKEERGRGGEATQRPRPKPHTVLVMQAVANVSGESPHTSSIFTSSKGGCTLYQREHKEHLKKI